MKDCDDDMMVMLCRKEIASCSEKAYQQLLLKDAQKLLMLDNEAAVLQFAQQVRSYATQVKTCIAWLLIASPGVESDLFFVPPLQ
jgi:CSN8/PSMD8/EIF3K family